MVLLYVFLNTIFSFFESIDFLKSFDVAFLTFSPSATDNLVCLLISFNEL
jgi:hypothetical protein